MKNTNRRAATISWILFFIFMLGIFIPGVLDMDGMNGGFALSALMVFLAVMTGSSGFVYGKLANSQDRIFDGKNLLVKWQLSQEEWQKYIVEEHRRDKQEKKMLFLMVAGWSFLFAVIFPVMDHENGYWISIGMAGLIVMIGIVALLSVSINHRSNLKNGGLVLISTYGVFFGGRMYAWGMAGGMLKQATDKKEYIEVTFLGGKTSYTIRIPVPAGEQQKAGEVTQKLAELAAGSKQGLLQRV